MSVQLEIVDVTETINGPISTLRFTVGGTVLPEVVMGYDGTIPLLEALRRAQAGKRRDGFTRLIFSERSVPRP